MRAERRQRRWAWWLAAILLLWLLFFQALGAARAASITFDEGPHLAVGYATLRTGDLRLQPVHIHPPLANLLAATPLLLDPDLPDPREISGWEIASLSAVTDAVVWQYPRPAQLALAGRLPIILLTLLAGALVLRWATDLGGTRAGLMALTLYVLDPNIVAHGALITTDMAVTAFGLLTFFLLYRYCRRPGRARRVGVGLALGLALASKVSAVLLVLLVGAVLVLHGWRRAARSKALTQAWRDVVWAWLTIALLALIVLWAVYGFELRALPGVTGSLPLPAATHLEIYQSLQEHYRLGHPAFLMGHNSEQGWWYYFPVAFLIKTPLPLLILLSLALIMAVRRRKPIHSTLALFPLVYMVTALFSSVDIGYRHLLPVLPFLHVFIAKQLAFFDSLRPRVLALRYIPVAGLILWLAVGSALVQPYPLTFFNALAGGPAGGYRWLLDSNLDWGQNLWQLRDWMRAEGVERVFYSHFSPARPEAYGVSVDWLPPDPRAGSFAPYDPPPGVYAIGATTLQGVYTPDVNTFAFFRARQPDAVLDHALFLYRVPERPEPDWAAVCFDVPLSDQQIRTGFGQAGLRLVYYDCANSQVYPAGGGGRFLLPPEVAWPAGMTLELQGRHPDGRPAYEILRPVERPTPARVAESVIVEGPLAFLGHDVSTDSVRPGQEIVLRAFWQVKRRPDRPLSLMAHLVGPDRAPVAVGDGLGIPFEQWKAGDIIIQQHRFVVPQDTPPGEYYAQTGAYWLDTQERWSIRRADGDVTDHLFLDKITVLD